MDYIQQLWQSSKTLRVVVCVAALGLVLTIATGQRNAPPPGTEPPASTSMWQRIKEYLPWGRDSLPNRVERTVGKTAEAFETGADALKKTADFASRKVDQVLQKVEPRTEPQPPSQKLRQPDDPGTK